MYVYVFHVQMSETSAGKFRHKRMENWKQLSIKFKTQTIIQNSHLAKYSILKSTRTVFFLHHWRQLQGWSLKSWNAPTQGSRHEKGEDKILIKSSLKGCSGACSGAFGTSKLAGNASKSATCFEFMNSKTKRVKFSFTQWSSLSLKREIKWPPPPQRKNPPAPTCDE